MNSDKYHTGELASIIDLARRDSINFIYVYTISDLMELAYFFVLGFVNRKEMFQKAFLTISIN